MWDWPGIVRDIFGYILHNREFWLLFPAVVLIVMWLVIATAGTTSVPVFIYPVA